MNVLKPLALIIAGAALVTIPLRLFVFKPKPKDDGVPVVAADAPLGDAPLGDTPPADTPPADAPAGNAAVPTSAPAAPTAEQAKKSDPKPGQKADWEDVARKAAPAVGVVEGKVGHGTGFLLSYNVLATNAHVINLEFEENLRVHFPSAPKGLRGPFKAKYIWSDRRRDLAFLRVECDVPFELELADDYQLRKAQEVMAIGTPGLGGRDKAENAIAVGHMSTVTKLNGLPYYQMNIGVNPGNSGGPVLDADGKVLGMVTAKLRDKDGIAFAIPVDDMWKAWHDHIEGASRDTTPDQVAWNRGNTVFERLMYLGDTYLAGLDAYCKAMEQAVAQGKSPNDGIRAAKKDLAPKLATLTRIFADKLEPNVTTVVADPMLVQEDRERVRQLWQTCQQMKTAFEKPSGTVASYRTNRDQMRKKFEQLLVGSTEPPKKAGQAGQTGQAADKKARPRR